MTNEQKAIMAFHEMIEEQEKQKREIADAVQLILRSTNHSEPTELLTMQQIEFLKGIPDLTPEQQALFKILIEQMVKESMDEGIKAAVAMIRMAPSGMPLAELANRIEVVVED